MASNQRIGLQTARPIAMSEARSPTIQQCATPRRKDHPGVWLAPGMIGDVEGGAAVGMMGAGERRVQMRSASASPSDSAACTA